MTEQKPLIAVITGDIVGFSKLEKSTQETFPATMREFSNRARKEWGEAIPMDIDIFGGDQWQIYVQPPKLALRIALFLRACVISTFPKTDTRISMAVGTADFTSQERVSLNHGQAFTESGRMLADEKNKGRMWFSAPGMPELATWNLVFRCLDEIIQRHWTHSRARAISGALRGLQQEQIAEFWNPPIKQPSVTENLDLGCWRTVEAIVLAFESAKMGE